jgi:hypothetical protein
LPSAAGENPAPGSSRKVRSPSQVDHPSRLVNRAAPNEQTPAASGGGVGGQVGQPLAPGNAVQTPQAPEQSSAVTQQIEDLRDRMTALGGRAMAMKDSVENLRRQQKAQGFTLRPDISASLSRMEQYMDKANAALEAGSPDAGKKNLDLAEREVEKLEQFFGR